MMTNRVVKNPVELFWSTLEPSRKLMQNGPKDKWIISKWPKDLKAEVFQEIYNPIMAMGFSAMLTF